MLDRIVFSLAASVAALWLLASAPHAMTAEPASAPADTLGLVNKPLEAYQEELLAKAMDVATAIPTEPHIKDRSAAQEKVVVACLEMDQPARARAYLGRIDNWRQGNCLAHLAYYCARNGLPGAARQYLEEAAEGARNAREWRNDRIRTRMAQAYTLLGDSSRAEMLEAGVAEAEEGKVDQTRAMLAGDLSFESHMATMDQRIARANFDPVYNALRTGVQLFDRFYEEAPRREQVENKIKSSWNILPPYHRMELLMDMVEAALERGGEDHARKLLDEAGESIEAWQWHIEDLIPVSSRLAALRNDAGDHEGAREALDDVVRAYFEQRGKIMNIFRAAALCPLGQAYESIGDHESALAVYRRALSESRETANHRPQAEDFALICASMATGGTEPDESLWQRLRDQYAALMQPW